MEPRVHRRLAAVLAADVVGYSRMMDADEAATLARLKRHRRDLFDPLVAKHGGRIVKLMGDGSLVEFASVVDAVNCAVALQRALAREPAGIVLRMGINLGDIIIDGDDIYGDGVNVAARIEPLAPEGGICITAMVDQGIGNRVAAAFRDRGEVRVKNIARPLRILTWHPDDEAGETPEAAPAGGPGTGARPAASIAVLPFDNMSGDAAQDYFSDGISEDIITDLSKVAGLAVIARNSSFAYRARAVDVRTVGRELDVGAVLEGSIRRAGDRVRITAQLVETKTGAHIWAERYDRQLTDIFAVQDDVTRHIVDALKVRLTADEAVRVAATPTAVPDAHDGFLRGREILFRHGIDKPAFEEIVALFSAAIRKDPTYAAPYAGLAHAHTLDYQNHWSGEADPLAIADHHVAAALARDSDLPHAHLVAAFVANWRHDLDAAGRHADRALALNPSYALAYCTRGFLEIYLGNAQGSLPFLERAIRLDPVFSQQYLHFVATAYLLTGKFELAATTFRERIRLSPNTDLSRAFLASTLGHLGRHEEARALWAELRTISPSYSFQDHISRLPFRNADDPALIAAGLAAAGLPD